MGDAELQLGRRAVRVQGLRRYPELQAAGLRRYVDDLAGQQLARRSTSIPAYMGTAVSTSITKNGNTITGTITKIVVVATAPGYASDPGHPGTGTIIATYC